LTVGWRLDGDSGREAARVDAVRRGRAIPVVCVLIDQRREVMSVSGSMVIRPSLRSGNILYLVVVTEAVAVGTIVVGLVGNVFDRGASQVLPWMVMTLFFLLIPVVYLRRVRICIDSEYVYVYDIEMRTKKIPRSDVVSIRRARLGRLLYRSGDGRYRELARDIWTQRQLDEFCAELGIRFE
jgi:hypothetical protein